MHTHHYQHGICSEGIVSEANIFFVCLICVVKFPTDIFSVEQIEKAKIKWWSKTLDLIISFWISSETLFLFSKKDVILEKQYVFWMSCFWIILLSHSMLRLSNCDNYCHILIKLSSWYISVRWNIMLRKVLCCFLLSFSYRKFLNIK